MCIRDRPAPPAPPALPVPPRPAPHAHPPFLVAHFSPSAWEASAWTPTSWISLAIVPRGRRRRRAALLSGVGG
eukprot:5980919-Pyramimonas_sp.AAC.1